jgi:hypothetical protein
MSRTIVLLSSESILKPTELLKHSYIHYKVGKPEALLRLMIHRQSATLSGLS